MAELQASDETLPSPVAGAHRPIRALVVLGLMSWGLYAGIAWLSQRFTFQTPGVERPIVAILLLLGAAFVVYLFALKVAVRASGRPEVSAIILLFAVAFRLLLLFTEPIQEVDIYRYLWDGQTTRQGVSPFRYSPQQVLQASRPGSHLRETLIPDWDESRFKDGGDDAYPADFARLVLLRDSSAAKREILSRVHFAELPTVYPPVSQAVFTVVAWCTPLNADVATHVFVMKLGIVLFDIATVFVLFALLKLAAKPAGWVVAYAWCPLVLKEFANSGHLDSIAVCLTTLAVYLAMKSFAGSDQSAVGDHRATRYAVVLSLSSAVVLALAVGAKLYPVVLAPLLVVMSARQFGWRPATGVAVAFLIVSISVCLPMLGGGHADSSHRTQSVSINLPSPSPSVPPPIAAETPPDSTHRDSGAGLKAFLSRWKMNDFLFLILIENLTPNTNASEGLQPWFVVTSNSWRLKLSRGVAEKLHPHLPERHIPFLLARTVTAGVFAMLVAWFGWQAWRSSDPSRLPEAAFLTLAWFFLLLPTQNPWYWIWALPFVPFARSKVWLVLSGLLPAYYLRFWLGYHWPDGPVPMTMYPGKLFFDYVVTWIEFGPWFVWLFYAKIRRNVMLHTEQNGVPGTMAKQHD